MMPRQLLLDFGWPPTATFDNFIVGANAELVAQLTMLNTANTTVTTRPMADRTFYLWGEIGSGRSHLLHALCARTTPNHAHARAIGPYSPLAAFEFDPTATLYTIDDCDALSPIQQIAAFHLFNEVHACPQSALVAAGNAPPLMLAVREDLRTRLGWGLVFQVLPLDDAGKIEALMQAARARGVSLAAEVPPYLLAHYKRDMPSLMRLLDALDRFSLEKQRAITLPLLRAMLTSTL